MTAKRITLKDVAREAGVSVSAVSLALRKHPGIPEGTRLRIREVADKLDYRPDPALAALGAHRQSMTRERAATTIAYLDTRNPDQLPESIVRHSEYLSGVRKRGKEMGYHIELFWMLREAGGDGARASRILRARGIRGIMIAPFESPAGELDLDWDHFCAVSLGRSMARPRIYAVSHDHAGAISLAFARFLELGYRRPGLALEPELSDRVNRRWLAGFLIEQLTHIRKTNRLPPFIGAMTPPDALFHWLHQQRPDVLITIGAGSPELIKSAGLNIPRDIGFVHLDTHLPEVSGIVQNMAEVGELAVQALHRILLSNEFGLPGTRQLTLVEGRWNAGETLRDRGL